jgi:hypothetical protein
VNEWPDDLWQQERSLTRDILAQFANGADEETDLSLCITESSDPKAVLGLFLTWCCCVVMGSLAVTVGWKLIQMMLRHKDIGSSPGRRHT